MKAIILAAGEGTRLRPYSDDRPKAMVELTGRPLLIRQLDVLKCAGIVDVTVITGYRAAQIEAIGCQTVTNARYASTNMVSSLMCAAHLLDGAADVLVTYGDIVYEPRIVQAIVDCPAPIGTTIDTNWLRLWQIRNEDPLDDAETLKLDDRGNIVELGKKPTSLDDIQGQYMGLIKISAAFAPQLVRIHGSLDPAGPYDGKDLDNMYMTSFLQYMIDHGQPVRAVAVSGGWLEVDTAAELELYHRLQSEGKLAAYCRLGG